MLMSADELREAARLMRERAEAATPGPWVVFDMDEADHATSDPLNGPGEGWYWVWSEPRLPYYGAVLKPQNGHPDAIIGSAAINDESGGAQEQADALHIASWSPTVALAVADWLVIHALAISLGSADPSETKAALFVARAYLGTEVTA